jgi:hypothetical protein
VYDHEYANYYYDDSVDDDKDVALSYAYGGSDVPEHAATSWSIDVVLW